MLQSKGTEPGDEAVLGDGVAFAGVSRYAARVKCALLAVDGVPGRPQPDRPRTLQPKDGHDRDRERRRGTAASSAGGTTTAEDVTEAMHDVVDPELGINVVDLGLVYGVTIDEDNVAVIDMTLTSAACPLTDVIEDQTNRRSRASSRASGSTGSGCRRGARTRSPKTAASSSGRSASRSDQQPHVARVRRASRGLQPSRGPETASERDHSANVSQESGSPDW